MNPRPDAKNITSEAEMLQLGRDFAEQILASPTKQTVFELIGDVGAGKTTFTRGLAAGLGIREPVTSPSFTISKRYVFPLSENASNKSTPTPENCCKNYNTSSNTPNNAHNKNIAEGQLIHYDFYRLDDPGIMRDELAEALAEPNSIIVVEWGSDVADLLPTDKIRLEISLREDGSRTVAISSPNPTSNPEPSNPTAQTQPVKDEK